MSIVYIILGIIMILWGADKLTDGSSAMARRMNVPEMVIGLTIVAFGTSMPEFIVSFLSALKGSSDMAIGNIVGSNIFNALAIVGCAALVAPMTITHNTVRHDMPIALVASILLLVLSLNYSTFSMKGGELSRIDGVILLIAFALFLYYTFQMAKEGSGEDDVEKKTIKKWKISLYIILGLVCLIVGGDLFVDGASEIARSLGVSESVIGLTLVACGTSLPELATSVIAARKGRSALAIGNVIGSNIFNIVAVLGISSIVSPMHIQGITMVDMLMMIFGILIIWFFSYTKYTVARWEGGVLVAIFAGYLVWLLH
jgi:cation:H+ antiporter